MPKNAHVITPDQPHYGLVCDFIKENFRQHYRAELEITETLFSLSLSGRILAACGMTRAHEQTLFLEHYTESGIETFCQVKRDKILEISHLAGASKGVSGRLFPALADYCLEQGVEVVVFTGTANLLKTFARFQIPLNRICPASEEKVKHVGGQWGSYYRHQPEVVWVSVREAATALFDNHQKKKEKEHVIF